MSGVNLDYFSRYEDTLEHLEYRAQSDDPVVRKRAIEALGNLHEDMRTFMSSGNPANCSFAVEEHEKRTFRPHLRA